MFSKDMLTFQSVQSQDILHLRQMVFNSPILKRQLTVFTNPIKSINCIELIKPFFLVCKMLSDV